MALALQTTGDLALCCGSTIHCRSHASLDYSPMVQAERQENGKTNPEKTAEPRCSLTGRAAQAAYRKLDAVDLWHESITSRLSGWAASQVHGGHSTGAHGVILQSDVPAGDRRGALEWNALQRHARAAPTSFTEVLGEQKSTLFIWDGGGCGACASSCISWNVEGRCGSCKLVNGTGR